MKDNVKSTFDIVKRYTSIFSKELLNKNESSSSSSSSSSNDGSKSDDNTAAVA